LTHTPVTLLTGFLGSGKTTLLNRALRDPALSQTAVVINEFGEISLDHILAATSDDTVVVLENGCLCCTVFGDLIGTLNSLYHRREAGEIPTFERVLIETSGLADPTPVVQAFLSDPTLAGLFRLGTIIATVDGVNGLGTLSQHGESRRQVAVADRLLVTKLDLIASEARDATKTRLIERLRSINRVAEIRVVDDPALSLMGLLASTDVDPTRSDEAARAWLNFSAYEDRDAGEQGGHHHHAHGDDDEHHHHSHHRQDIVSFAFVREEPTSRYALQLLLDALEKNLGPNLLRVKGLVNVAEEPNRPAVVQGAQHLLHNITWLDRWPDADRRTRIVFITQNFEREEVEEMISLLDRVAARTANARSRAAAKS
jgi:G3E family GTPase